MDQQQQQTKSTNESITSRFEAMTSQVDDDTTENGDEKEGGSLDSKETDENNLNEPLEPSKLTESGDVIAAEEMDSFPSESPDVTSLPHLSETERNKTLSLDALCFQCPCCDATFASVEQLMQHTPTHDRPRRKLTRIVVKRQLDPDRPHQCDPATTPPPTCLKLSHVVVVVFRCSLCTKSFSSELRLSRHYLLHNTLRSVGGKSCDAATDLDGEEKSVSCDVCLRSFKNNSALGCHMKTHSQRKYYSCPMCTEDFDRQIELRQHAVMHMTNGVYPCSFCHKVFPNLRESHL